MNGARLFNRRGNQLCKKTSDSAAFPRPFNGSGVGRFRALCATRLLSWVGFVAAAGRQAAVRAWAEIAPYVLLRSLALRRALAVRPRERSRRRTPAHRKLL